MAKGLFDSQELIGSLINDCNEAVKQLVGGQYILWCATMANMAKKLSLLKDGVRDDIMNKQDQIECLKEQLRKCGRRVDDITSEQLANGDIPHGLHITEVDEDGDNRDMV